MIYKIVDFLSIKMRFIFFLALCTLCTAQKYITPPTNLLIPRKFFSAASCSSTNMIYFAGGMITKSPYTYTKSVEIFNIFTNQSFNNMTLTNAVRDPAAASTSRYAVFAGGENNDFTFNSIDIFDSVSFTKKVSNLSISRTWITSASLNGIIYYAGGVSKNYVSFYNNIDIVNPTTGVVTYATLSNARAGMAGAADSVCVYFAGGVDVNWMVSKTIDYFCPLLYDTTWKTGQLTIARAMVSAFSSPKSYGDNYPVLIAGGLLGGSDGKLNYVPTNIVESLNIEYQIIQGSYVRVLVTSRLSNLSVPRAYMQPVQFSSKSSNEQIAFVGGATVINGQFTTLTTIDIFKGDGTFVDTLNMPNPLDGFAAVSINDRFVGSNEGYGILLVAGGSLQDEIPRKNIAIFSNCGSRPDYFNGDVVMYNYDAWRCGCPLGYSCPRYSIVPYDCPIGYYCSWAWQPRFTPVICPRGTYCNTKNLDRPIICNDGFYCPNFGMTAPLNCSIGHICPYETNYSGGISIGLIQQKPCPPGGYCPRTKMSFPDLCPPGMYCPNSNGNFEPILCPKNTFSPKRFNQDFTINMIGATTCEKCPEGYESSEGTQGNNCIIKTTSQETNILLIAVISGGGVVTIIITFFMRKIIRSRIAIIKESGLPVTFFRILTMNGIERFKNTELKNISIEYNKNNIRRQSVENIQNANYPQVNLNKKQNLYIPKINDTDNQNGLKQNVNNNSRIRANNKEVVRSNITIPKEIRTEITNNSEIMKEVFNDKITNQRANNFNSSNHSVLNLDIAKNVNEKTISNQNKGSQITIKRNDNIVGRSLPSNLRANSMRLQNNRTIRKN